MTARAIYGGVPTFQLPPAKGGPGQVIQSLGNGYTEWVTGGGGGGGVVDEVQAGQNIAVDSTNPAVPVVSLDLPAEPSGGKFLTSTETVGLYTWTKANDPGIQQVQGSQYIEVNTTSPTAPVVALKLPSEPETGKVLTTTSLNGVYEWKTPGGGGGGGITEVQAGQNIAVDSTNPTVPVVSLDLPAEAQSGKVLTTTAEAGVYAWDTPITTISGIAPISIQTAPGSRTIELQHGGYLTVTDSSLNLAVAVPSAPDLVLSSTTSGVLSWVPNSGGGGGITEVQAGQNIAVDSTNPTVPVVSLDLPAEPFGGKVLTTTAEAGVYAWDTPITTISGIAPISIQTAPGSRTIELQHGGYLTVVDSSLNLAVAVPSTPDLVLSSTTSGVLSWVPNSGGGGGITEVQAGQFVAVDSTNPTAPVVKVQINGTYSTGLNVGSNDGGASLDWVTPYAYTAGFGISLVAETVTDSSINLNVEGTPGPGKVIEFNGDTGGIVWADPGVASIEAGANVVVSSLDGIYTIRVPIGNTYEPGKFVGGNESGNLQWETPTGSGGGITGITQGPGILVANTDPAAPTVSIDLTAGFGMAVNNELATVALAPQGNPTEGALLSLVSGELTWTAPTPSVTRVEAGDNVTVTEPLTGVYNVAVPISNTHATGKFVGADQNGVLEWAYPPTADPYTAGFGLALDSNQFSISAEGTPQAGDYPAFEIGATANNLKWTTPTTGTVKNVQGNDYIYITGVSTENPTVELNIESPVQGTNGQVLTATATTNLLKWTTPTVGTVTSVGALNYMLIGGNTFVNPDVGLKFAAGPYAQVGQVLTAADTVGDSLKWTTPTTGTVTNVLGNDYIYISGSSTNIPTVELNIEGEPQGQAGQVLTASGTTNLLKWTTPGTEGYQIIPTAATLSWFLRGGLFADVVLANTANGGNTTVLKLGKMCISNAAQSSISCTAQNFADYEGVMTLFCQDLGTSFPRPLTTLAGGIVVAGNCVNQSNQQTHVYPGRWTFVNPPYGYNNMLVYWNNDAPLVPVPNVGDILTFIMPGFVYETA